MEIIVRPMEPNEAPEVRKIGRRAFSGLEGLGVTKPKQAFVAVRDGKIAGAIQVKFYRAGGKKIGYYDYAFVDSACHNQGIGSVLYKETTRLLWDQGCDALTALVKDDNVGSWGLFQKNGFARMSLPELARRFGLFGMLRLYLGTVYSVAIGMDYYVALKDERCETDKGGSAKQMAAYLLANLLLFLVMALRRPEGVGTFFAAYAIFLVGGILAGYAGTLLAKRKWRFRLCNGGGLVCALVCFMGTVYPMVGNWYPDRYENSNAFRRDMGLQAAVGWAFVLVLTLLPVLVQDSILFRYIEQIGSTFLLFRLLALYPFEAFGGGRVFRWNKGVYFLLSLFSLAVYALNLIW